MPIICIGFGAEATQEYEFVLALPNGRIMRTLMTPEEHQVIRDVLTRADQETAHEPGWSTAFGCQSQYGYRRVDKH